MPADPFAQLGSIAEAGLVVALVALPLALLTAILAWRFGHALIPRWQPSQATFGGLEIVFLFGVFYTVMIAGVPVLESLGLYAAVYGPDFPASDVSPTNVVDPAGAAGGGPVGELARKQLTQFRYLRHLWASLFVAPILLVIGFAMRRLLHAVPIRFDTAAIPQRLTFGVVCWLLMSPVVYGIYFLTLYFIQTAGGAAQDHPLTELGPGRTLANQFFFGCAVCFFTPLVEEFLFRGLLVRWAAGRWYRPWILVALAALFAFSAVTPAELDFSPLFLVLVLGLGLHGLQLFHRARPRFPIRVTGGVFGSAALFAAAHSSVWPTPVPLFFLGLVLGYIAIRSRSLIGPVVFHGLFNAVSFVFLLRNAPA